MNSYSQLQMVQQNCQEETTNSENPLKGGNRPVRSEDLSGEIQGESGESQPAQQTDDVQARADFWSIQGDFIYRHHTEPRVQLYVPKEKTFPIPLKHIDVTASAHVDLDVLQEKRIDDYWSRKRMQSRRKTLYGCIVESHESTGPRPASLQSKVLEDRIAGKGNTSMTH